MGSVGRERCHRRLDSCNGYYMRHVKLAGSRTFRTTTLGFVAFLFCNGSIAGLYDVSTLQRLQASPVCQEMDKMNSYFLSEVYCPQWVAS